MNKKKERKQEDIDNELLAEKLIEEGLSTEYWKTLIYNGETYPQFEVSNLGRVRTSCNHTLLTPTKTGIPDYLYVRLPSEYLGYSMQGSIRVNRCVSWTFHGKPPKGYTSDHINRNRYDNREVNLRWASRRTQMQNRNNTVLVDCGIPVVDYIRNLGYDIDINGGIGQYLVAQLRKGITLTDAYFNWANYINPYPKVWKGGENIRGIEYLGVWYPNKRSLVKFKGNCVVEVYRERIKDGMSVEEALNYKYDQAEKYRFEMDGHFMTTAEHCERLCISHQRISVYQTKRGLSFEEAVKVPVERVIKHNIDGETKRNTEWYELYNIPARTANAWMVSKMRDGSSFNRTFRDVLEKYKVDTSSMEIYPCDGEVVMKNKPL